MKITRRDYRAKTFGDLPEGAIFVDESDSIAMKIEEVYGDDDSRINAVYLGLGNGALCFFPSEEEVKEVNAELIVE